MDDLSVRIVEPEVGYERRAIGNPAATGRARLARSGINSRPRDRRTVARREHCRGVLLLAGFLLVAYAPFARLLDHPETLSEIGGDRSIILAGAGVVLILAVCGEHLLTEYSRLVRLTATVRRPRRSSGQ